MNPSGVGQDAHFLPVNSYLAPRDNPLSNTRSVGTNVLIPPKGVLPQSDLLYEAMKKVCLASLNSLPPLTKCLHRGSCPEPPKLAMYGKVIYHSRLLDFLLHGTKNKKNGFHKCFTGSGDFPISNYFRGLFRMPAQCYALAML